MKRLNLLFVAVSCVGLTVGASRADAAVAQLGLVIDVSTSFDGSDEAIAKAGITAALSNLFIDGSVELTVVQFSASALTVYNPTVINSIADRDAAIAAVNAMVQSSTDVAPFNGGTNFEAAFNEIVAKITGSSEFAGNTFSMINFITDGNPTAHNHFGLEDIVTATRLQRARDFGKTARDAAVAAGIDVISFELVDPPAAPAGITYVNTLAYPGSAPFDAPPFPDPITSKGFIIDLAGVSEIEDALNAKFVAAGLAVPEPATALLLVLGAAAVVTRRRA